MGAADADAPIADAEAAALFADLSDLPGLVLAVSGGPDSTALLYLIARWRGGLRAGPDLLAVTVNHGLRPQARDEASAVKRLAASLGVPHRTLPWRGLKPRSGLQEAARAARYRLLAQAARSVGLEHIVTAHTRDDQAETVLFRLARGSGVAGLAGMAPVAPVPVPGGHGITLVRPLLDVPKARLIATLERAGIPYAEDASNRDPRFTRARLRGTMPLLAAEGLDSIALARVAARARRAEAALEWATDEALRHRSSVTAGGKPQATVASALEFQVWPADIALRALRRQIDREGTEGPVELGKLEALFDALLAALAGGQRRWRRTLAGAVVSLEAGWIMVAPAPPRRQVQAPRATQRAAAAAVKAMPAVRRFITK